MSIRTLFVVLGMALLLPATVEASVVSRLGAIFFYDPLSFDAGVLQRGGKIRSGLGSGGFSLDVSADLPMFQDLSLRLGYAQRLEQGARAGHDLAWRVRMPILEGARYGRLMSVQVIYAGHHPFGLPDALSPRHEVSGAYSASFARSGLGTTLHTQLGLLVRYRSEVEESLALGRVGLAARGAFLTQLYRPGFGRGGAWSVTLSIAEITLHHYGASRSHVGDGRLTAAAAAPAIHFSPGSATYTLGLVPEGSMSYGSSGIDFHWGGMLVVSGFHRAHTE